MRFLCCLSPLASPAPRPAGQCSRLVDGPAAVREATVDSGHLRASARRCQMPVWCLLGVLGCCDWPSIGSPPTHTRKPVKFGVARGAMTVEVTVDGWRRGGCGAGGNCNIQSTSTSTSASPYSGAAQHKLLADGGLVDWRSGGLAGWRIGLLADVCVRSRFVREMEMPNQMQARDDSIFSPEFLASPKGSIPIGCSKKAAAPPTPPSDHNHTPSLPHPHTPAVLTATIDPLAGVWVVWCVSLCHFPPMSLCHFRLLRALPASRLQSCR